MRGEPDTGHATGGPALRPHGRRAEPEQLGIAGDEDQVLVLAIELRGADDAVAIFQGDHLEF